MTEIVLPMPHAAQEQVLRERRRFNVLACGRRWGKTKMGGSIAIQAAVTGLPVGWFAPSYKTLGDALTEIIGRTRNVAKYTDKEKRLSFPSGGHIEFWSTQPEQAGDDESEVARGRKYAEVIYDEAAHARRLKADWTKAIRPTLSDYRGGAWFLTTPKGQNYLHKLWLRGQDDDPEWKSWKMPTAANPHIHPDEIESAKRDLPNDAFEQEYLAEFLANAANPFGLDAIRACIAPLTTDAVAPPVCYGVDLAKSHDWVVAIGLNAAGHVQLFQRWQGPWEMTTARLIGIIGHAPCYMDSTGVGDPIVERLKPKCPGIVGYNFAGGRKQPLMEGLAWAIQNRAVAYPDGMIVRELESYEYEYTASGVRYDCPAGMHDDCVCALALAVMCKARAPVFDFRLIGGAKNRMAELDDDSRHWREVER